MFFNDDSMLDFRANGMSDAIFGGYRGVTAGEMTFVGRAPGALYAEGLSSAESFHESTQFPEELLAAIAKRAANDEEPRLSAPLRAKDAEPLVLIAGDVAEAVVLPDLAQHYDLDIPPLPVSPPLPTVTVTPPGSVPAEPVAFGGPAYQSLAFLILDTPFVVGDDHLPPTVRPSLEDLLGLAGDDAWVLPPSDIGAWRLG